MVDHGPWVRCETCGKEVRGRLSLHEGAGIWVPVWHKTWAKEPCSGRFYEAELVERENAHASGA